MYCRLLKEVSAVHRFDCTLTIGTTALCNASHSVFLGREKVLLEFSGFVKLL